MFFHLCFDNSEGAEGVCGKRLKRGAQGKSEGWAFLSITKMKLEGKERQDSEEERVLIQR